MTNLKDDGGVSRTSASPRPASAIPEVAFKALCGIAGTPTGDEVAAWIEEILHEALAQRSDSDVRRVIDSISFNGLSMAALPTAQEFGDATKSALPGLAEAVEMMEHGQDVLYGEDVGP